MPRKSVIVDPTTLTKWEHISLKWEDAFETSTTPIDSTEFIEEYTPCDRHTLGWFLGYDGKRIFMTSTNDSHSQVDGVDTDNVLVIPFGMVVDLRRLQRKKRAKKVSPPAEETGKSL